VTYEKRGFHMLSTIIGLSVRFFYYHDKITYFKQSLEKDVSIPFTKEEFPWRAANENDFGKLEAFYRPSSKLETPSKRYQRGDFCFIALDGEIIIAMIWCATKTNYVYPLKKTINIETGKGCFYHILTGPEYRGRGLYASGICRLSNILRNRGFKEVLLYISERNISSLKGIKKTTFVPFMEEELNRYLFLKFYKAGRAISD
jgi:hypothetical protein